MILNRDQIFGMENHLKTTLKPLYSISRLKRAFSLVSDLYDHAGAAPLSENTVRRSPG